METFSALLALCVGNSPVTGEFPAQRPVKRSFDVFFDLRLDKRLNKQSRGWWCETLSRSLWRHCNASQLIDHNWHTEDIMFKSLWMASGTKVVDIDDIVNVFWEIISYFGLNVTEEFVMKGLRMGPCD